MSETPTTKPDAPLLVRHGEKIWCGVEATRATVEEILGILTPDESSPVLDSLARIEAMLQTLLAVMLPPAAGANAP